METHTSVASMAAVYAEKAVALAREFKARLDYSENSLMEVETILAQLSRELPTAQPATEDLTEIDSSPPHRRRGGGRLVVLQNDQIPAGIGARRHGAIIAVSVYIRGKRG